MSVRHQVPDEMLLDFVVGGAGAGKQVLLSTHLAMSGASRERYGMMREVGGALLEALDGEPLTQATAERVLRDASVAQLETTTELGRADQRSADKTKLCGTVLPPPLASITQHAHDPKVWRTIGFGVKSVLLPCSSPKGRTHLLYARPGVQIAPHTHTGEELVLVLSGAFTDDGEVFEPGDLAVNDSSRVHAPVIDTSTPCLCLVVTEGPIRYTGKAGWLLNRFCQL